jgi:hypothetical protein
VCSLWYLKISQAGRTKPVSARLLQMETKQAFQEELERYRVLLAETTDPVGLLLLKDIISEMEEVERKWDSLKRE